MVTPLSTSTTYGSAAPAITPSYTGFVNGDSAASLTTQPTCNTTVTAATSAGSYSSTCSGASDPNYTISYQVGTVTVAPAPLSIAASSGTMTYGDTAPTIAPSYSGFVNGDSGASLATPPTCGTAATSSSSVGNYASTCSGAVDLNYSITYTNGTIAVGAAQLVITASSSSTTYGGDPPAVTASYKGFENGDTAASLSTPPTCTTADTASSPVGSYSATCSGAVDPNYTITYSNGSVEVDPAPLTITASSGMSTYGASPPSVTPSVSGLQNSENSTVLGNTLTCTTAASGSSPVGTYATSCSGAVDGNYSITYAQGTIMVTPAPLSITAASGSMTYAGAVPTVTPTISGLKNGEDIDVLGSALGCSSDANSSSPVGSYTTTCAGASDANYSITYIAGSITVNPAHLTMSASSASMTYGGTVPTIVPVISGLQNGDEASDLGSAIECSTAASTTSGAGSYATACDGAVDANYDISYAYGSVTVNPAALIVTASSPSMTFGDTPPAITASYDGFVNSDSATSLTTAPICSTTATSASPVGNYPTSCVGGVDPNYTISYDNGTLQVSTAQIVVTASSASMTYGGGAPAITASYSGFVNGDSASSLTSTATCSAGASSSSPVGSYVSSCTGAADPDYSFSYASGSVQVDPAPLTIAASSASLTYGGASANVTPTYSGFVNGDNAASLGTAPSCSTTATSSSPVGNYPSSCSGAIDPNYTISYVPGEVVVGSATLVVTASSESTSYGGSVPSITPSYAGFVNGESASSLTSQATCSTTATPLSPVGSYPTSCSGAIDPNYTIVYVVGAVDIGTAPLSVTALSTSMTYGDSVPSITPSYAGFVNEDNASSLTSQATCSTTATPLSPVGIYPSSCSGASNSNYTVTYVSGSVEVGRASLTITASSPSTTYGASVPSITASFSGFVNGDDASVLTATPVCTTNASSTSPVGTYTTLCNGAAAGNYAINYANGEATIGQASLSITASSASITYGGAAPTIAASYSGFVNGDSQSSLSTQPLCTSAVTSISGVGTYSSSCSGAADLNYTISYINGSVQVDPMSLTITASSASATYGGSVPATTASFNGFVNTDTASSLTTPPTCTTTATSTSPVGNYPTDCSGAVDANYTISYVAGTLQVGAAPLIVTASTGSMTYGGTPPPISPSYSGFVNGDSSASLSNTPLCSSTAGSSSPVGTYSTSCSAAADSNYTISYVVGEVIVGPAPLAIAASSSSMTYGGTAPTINPSYSGFVNGDDAGSLTTTPACSATATSSSPVGSYPSSCSGAVDDNYTVSYVSGAVVVKAAPLTVTASSASATYGGTIPAITPSYAGFVNGDGASSLSAAPNCSTTATSSSSVGNYASNCSGAADANYSISFVPGVVAVGSAKLVITASSGSMTYGGAAPTATPSYSGFVDGDTAASLTTSPTCSTSATSTSSVGSVATSCTGAVDPDYSIVYVNGSVSITPAPLTITASSGTMTFGGTPPGVTASYSGFVNGQSASSLATKPTCSTAATSLSTVGTYSTNCSGAAGPNYAISYSPGSVVVSPAPLTITASSASMTYGGTVPTISASFSRFPSGQSASNLTGLTCSAAVTSASIVGTYQSNCSGVTNANYTISYVSGTVTVNPATLTVTANNVSKPFGTAVPALTATITGYVNGQTLATSGVTGSPACSTTATATSAGGTYPITCSISTLAAVNYVFAFVPGTLTVTFTTTVICDHLGSIVVTSGESVLIPPGCVQVGDISVHTNGSLEIEGAIVVGSIGLSSGAGLEVCSTNLAGNLSATLAATRVVIGDDTSACLGNVMVSDVTFTSNSAGITFDRNLGAGSVAVDTNANGVQASDNAWLGQMQVEKNTGGATVTSNGILGSLTVSGNTGSISDGGNTVVGSKSLQ